ncbi:complex I intermediate-associated protein 30-domain-containing protein [Talaromyces proteolyticus]|uniref:Complex I intermediate-associated protein 30-domain-containing protein n=1 Tax=Talaromyces proteolyticus TaxID=1131652 RepID=A0AAD4Q2Q4_9EURO|nr:complex I intermediate-associated protein 30-domain-containing protein [Talaromyces proteolyticus]KAH8703922.1 complex I intermediate-associated protein 30-domain-containing protein [Talaromyces proteolyticus]
MFPTPRCLAAKAPGFFKKSTGELSRLARIALNAEAISTPTKPYPLLDFSDPAATASCKTMADRAVGGFSTAQLDFIPATATDPAHTRFHGTISTKLPNNWRVERTGYAAFRNRDRGFWLLGRLYWDADPYAYLALRVKSDGRRYMVNLQTESVVETDIHQHRLYTRHHRVYQPPPLGEGDEGRYGALSDIPPAETIISTATTTGSSGSGWETILLPFHSFVRTNYGMIVEPQQSLIKQKIKSIGIGLIDRVEGPYDLRIHRIWATNGMSEEEVEEERSICGENALGVDEGVRTLWGSKRDAHGKEGSHTQRKEEEEIGKRKKGLEGLKGEWEQ